MLGRGSKYTLARRCPGRGHAHIRTLGTNNGQRHRLGAQTTLAPNTDKQVPVVLVVVMVAPLRIMVQTALRRSSANNKFLLRVVLASMCTDPAACYQRQHAQEQYTQC